MSAPRSMFTAAIEDHLALKKQNADLNEAMPLSRFEVGDPLERYPGGPVRAVTDADVETAATSADAASAESGAAATQVMEAAAAFDTRNVMSPSLSLVEDIDEADVLTTDVDAGARSAEIAEPEAAVLRFPGGVGPRDETSHEPATVPPAPTAEPDIETSPLTPQTADDQPVIVIDADEPIATIEASEPLAARSRKSRRFSLRRRKAETAETDGWFAGTPRDFTWDD